jgi:hypothetical protein
MQYLQSSPFSVALGSRKYSENYERIFGKKDRDTEPAQEPEAVEQAPDTERQPGAEQAQE